MSDTNFTDGNKAAANRIVAAWLNDVNKLRYQSGDATRGAALLDMVQSGTGAVARTVQDKLRDIVALADFDTLGHYNTAVAALGNTGKYSFGGSINLPGAAQGAQITWNTSDIFLYRLGAGRFSIQIEPDSSGDQSVDIHNTYTTGQGSNRLRIWSYDANVQGNQHYLEIYVSRDIGLEGNFYNSAHAGSVAAVDHVWEFDGVAKMRLSATAFTLSVAQDTVGTDAAVNLTFKANGTNRWAVLQSNGTLFPFTDGNIDIGSTARRVQTFYGATLDSGTGTLNLNTLSAADIKWGKANVALGGGAAPTVGTIGGAGPAAAAQRNWLRFIESDGTASFIPVWR